MRTAVFLCLLGLTVSLTAQPIDAPHNERGFSANKVFEIGDIDHVSPLDGSLVLTLPIGPDYPLRPGFDYGLTLSYSGKIWDVEYNPNPAGPNDYFVIYEPYGGFNAGVGWTLSLGQLLEPQAMLNDGNSQWVYVSGDGSRHDFFSELHPGAGTQANMSFTRDNSYLRMEDVNGASREVHFPDGSRRFFIPGSDGAWNLSRIEDAFGNWVNVTQTNSLWTIADMHGRQHTVSLADGQVTAVKLEQFGTNVLAEWTFGYSDVILSLSDCGLTNTEPDDKRTFDMKFLTSITRPDGSTYSMPLAEYAIATGQQFCNPTTGRLRGMTLPTRGKIEWDYGLFPFPRENCTTAGCAIDQQFTPNEAVQGIVERRLVSSTSSTIGTWTYEPELDLPLDGSERTTLVTDPLGHQTKYYFSVHRHTTNFSGGWTRYENGLPFTHNQPFLASLPGGYSPEVYLSQEIFEAGDDPETDEPIRSVWVRYERELPISNELEHAQHANRRMVHQLTLYHDTSGSGNDGFTEVEWSDFDGLGNFRTERRRGNLRSLSSIEWRETHTEFNPGTGELIIDPSTGQQTGSSTFVLPSASAPWVLNTSSYTESRQQSSTTRRVETTYRSDGFLLCQRLLVGPSNRSSNDVMRVFTDANDDGNADSQKSYGGDAHFLSTAAGCSASGTPEYQTDFSYSSGALSKAIAVTPCGGGTEDFQVLTDLDIDSHTGLTSKSQDAAGTPTQFAYDSLGRMTSSTPLENPSATLGADATTHYSYTNAVGNNAAYVDVRRGSFSSPLTHSRMLFDDWGRLCREQSLLPGGWNDRRTAYTATGLSSDVTELVDGGGSPQVTCGSVGSTPHTSYTGYDPFGRVATVTPPDGASHNVSFTRTGIRREVRSVSTAIGTGGSEQQVSRTSWFDSFGRLRGVSEISDPNSGAITTDYFYDAHDRLTHVQTLTPNPGLGNQHRFFSYDGRGFMSSEQHPELGPSGDGAITYTYDSRGNVLTRDDGRTVLRTTYDAASRPVQVWEDPPGGLSRLVKEYFYATKNYPGQWSHGQLVEARRHHYVDLANPMHRGTDFTLITVLRLTYGGLGGRVSRVVTTAETTLGSAYAFETSYSYDSLGNVVSVDYPDCLHSGCSKLAPEVSTVTMGYSRGLLTSIPGYISSITYHDNGLINQVNHQNGMVDTATIASNGMARPSLLQSTGGSSWDSGVFAYDGAGNIKAIGGDIYTYDRVNRLLRADLDQSVGSGHYRAYTYDWHGNRPQIDRNGFVTNEPIDPMSNRLSNGTYDESGNLKDFGGAFFLSWDATNTLMAHQGPDFSKVYLYTADDERLATIDLSDLGAGNIEETWTLRGLGGQVLRTYTTMNSSWSWDRDYIYRGGRLAASETMEDAGTLYYHLDHLGSPRLITTTAGTEKSSHVYFPFGEEWTAPGEEQFKFTGHERDFNGELVGSGDDLDYMHARYCSSAFGRFLSVDPANSAQRVAPQTWNKFSYALGNPVLFIDPDGRKVTIPSSLRSVVERGINGSTEFRRIFNRLNDAPVSRVDITLTRVQRARANTFAESGLTRELIVGKSVEGVSGNVLLPFRAARDPAVVGHELFHAEEFLDLPPVLREELLERPDVWESAGGAGVETQGAIDKEQLIREQLGNHSGEDQFVVIWTCEGRACTAEIRSAEENQ